MDLLALAGLFCLGMPYKLERVSILEAAGVRRLQAQGVRFGGSRKGELIVLIVEVQLDLGPGVANVPRSGLGPE